MIIAFPVERSTARESCPAPLSVVRTAAQLPDAAAIPGVIVMERYLDARWPRCCQPARCTCPCGCTAHSHLRRCHACAFDAHDAGRGFLDAPPRAASRLAHLLPGMPRLLENRRDH